MSNENSTAKHTPGPWHLNYSAEMTLIHIEADHVPDGRIATISPVDAQSDGGRSYIIEEANARLIAAAPELLEMLWRFMEAGEGNPSDKEVIDRLPWDEAEKLIKKAEGRA